MANTKIPERVKESESNIIDNLVKEASKLLQEEMDRHLLAMVFKEDGWTEVVVDPWRHSSTSAIESWCDNHVTPWYRSGNTFLFKNPEAATMFMLRWS